MSDENMSFPADRLFAEGMKYDLSQDRSPEAATLARAAFQQAAAMGHTKAIRALAHLLFDGRGGPRNQEQALVFLWSAFHRGDMDALEELEDMLETFSELTPNGTMKTSATQTAQGIVQLRQALSQVSEFMHKLVRNGALDHK